MQKENLSKAYIALAIVSVFWGTTYFALLIGVTTFPPFLFSGIRQFTAGVLFLTALFLLKKVGKWNWKNALYQTVPGILMIAVGNGVIGWAEQYIPSGLAALIASSVPLMNVALNYASGTDKRKPNAFILSGLTMGAIGVIFIFKDNIADMANSHYFTGMLITFLACLSWASGSVFSKKFPSKENPLVNAAIQMLAGGIALFIMSLFLDDYNRLHHITAESIYALIYLIFIGSLLSYTCFVYALQKLPLGISSLYAYINPFIALLLGFIFLNESLTIYTGFALICVLLGVYLVNKGYIKQKNS